MKILFATDGSESAKMAMEFLQLMPLPKNAEISLVTVIDKELYRGMNKHELNKDQRQLQEETKQLLKEDADTLLAKDKAHLQASGWLITTEILSGHPAKEIVRAARRLTADLVVVGSHGTSGFKRFLLGSTSDQVLAYSPCSVLIVRPWNRADDEEKLKVLLAYDDSPSAKKAVGFFSTLPLNERVELHLLTVMALIHLYRQDIKQRLSLIWNEKKRHATEALEQLASETDWHNARLTTELREAEDVSHEIIELANERESDLLVLGHKGKSAVKKFLVGSVTSRLAHHAPCSVLAVRSES
jgi:nucleotide-binding universal stress UspA family protein